MAFAKKPEKKSPVNVSFLVGDLTEEERKHVTTPWEPVWCGGFDYTSPKTGEHTKDAHLQLAKFRGRVKGRSFHHFNPDKRLGKCGCPPGPSILAIRSRAFEIAHGGGRGGAKTESGFMIALRAAEGIGVEGYQPYINYPNYKCLVLRKNSKDLLDWFTRARSIYTKMGAVALEEPRSFRWPSGAIFVLDHMDHADAYEKYQGQEWQTIIFEEATQCASEQLYQRIKMSCRSSDPRMVPKIYLTANPGGPGMAWFKKRFWDLKMPDGTPIRRGEVYRDRFGNTRTFIHSTVFDNPYFMRTEEYLRTLETNTGVELSRWLYGNFDAFDGAAFDMFRPEGPIGDEPVEARHVIPDETPIPAWWPRVIAVDVGYRHSTAVIKAAISPDNRLIIYEEKAAPGITAEVWGYELAKGCLKELEGLPDKRIDLYLSHEAIGRRDSPRSWAEQFQDGMNQCLGHGAAVVIDQGETSDVAAVQKRYDLQTTAKIAIRAVRPNRVNGWNYIRELMRFTPLYKPLNREEFDFAEMRRIYDKDGEEAANKYRQAFLSASEKETLPKLMITQRCQGLIRAIQGAVFNNEYRSDKAAEDILKTQTEADDLLDALNKLCLGFKYRQNLEPREVYVSRRMDELLTRNPHMTPNQIWAAKVGIQDAYTAEQKVANTFRFTMRVVGPERGMYGIQ